MRQLKEGVFSVGAIDWERRLFDELIPLPAGTSYNSYLVRGSGKTVLLDTVAPEKVAVLIDNLISLGVDKIDYIVSHHAEQDHSGSIPDILILYPDAKVLTSPKCKSMLIDLLAIDDEKFQTVEDGEEISLGDKTLKFIYIPWVHWPETMGTYLKEDKIFFPCDFFGSHLAASSLFADDRCQVYESAKRYYAEIMMPFRTAIKKNLEKLKDYEIDMIAPSHGPVYDEPEFIIDAYQDWISDTVKNEVVLPYVSMHGSTELMVNYLINALIERGIKVKPFNLTVTDVGQLAISLVDAATIVVGCSTILAGPHPAAAYACILANALKPKTKFLSLIGSYGWATKISEQILGLVPNIKAEVLGPVIARGAPSDNDYTALEKLADNILEKHRELGLIK